jgi:hypothetical protein
LSSRLSLLELEHWLFSDLYRNCLSNKNPSQREGSGGG